MPTSDHYACECDDASGANAIQDHADRRTRERSDDAADGEAKGDRRPRPPGFVRDRLHEDGHDRAVHRRLRYGHDEAGPHDGPTIEHVVERPEPRNPVRLSVRRKQTTALARQKSRRASLGRAAKVDRSTASISPSGMPQGALRSTEADGERRPTARYIYPRCSCCNSSRQPAPRCTARCCHQATATLPHLSTEHVISAAFRVLMSYTLVILATILRDTTSQTDGYSEI